jgi:hypothetical protein
MVTIRHDGWSYTLSNEDRLWLAVSAAFEGGDDPADIWWTYVQRLATPGFKTWTMQRLVAAHSQPVNPIWRRDGEKCRPGGASHGTARCSEQALDRRDRAAAMLDAGWIAVPDHIARRFHAWESGLIRKRVGKANDFADPSVAEGFIARNPGSAITLRAGNWFVASPSAPPDGSVRVSFGRSPLPTMFVGAVAGGLLAWWKHRKRAR